MSFPVLQSRHAGGLLRMYSVLRMQCYCTIFCAPPGWLKPTRSWPQQHVYMGLAASSANRALLIRLCLGEPSAETTRGDTVYCFPALGAGMITNTTTLGHSWRGGKGALVPPRVRCALCEPACNFRTRLSRICDPRAGGSFYLPQCTLYFSLTLLRQIFASNPRILLRWLYCCDRESLPICSLMFLVSQCR